MVNKDPLCFAGVKVLVCNAIQMRFQYFSITYLTSKTLLIGFSDRKGHVDNVWVNIEYSERKIRKLVWLLRIHTVVYLEDFQLQIELGGELADLLGMPRDHAILPLPGIVKLKKKKKRQETVLKYETASLFLSSTT